MTSEQEVSNRVGPVIMGHPIARAYLESTGVVLSFRTSDRTTGETHYRYKRTGVKQGDVRITKETNEITPVQYELKPHRPLSGFSTVDDWRAAIEDVHGSLTETGYVYRIEMIDDE